MVIEYRSILGDLRLQASCRSHAKEILLICEFPCEAVKSRTAKMRLFWAKPRQLPMIPRPIATNQHSNHFGSGWSVEQLQPLRSRLGKITEESRSVERSTDRKLATSATSCVPLLNCSRKGTDLPQLQNASVCACSYFPASPSIEIIPLAMANLVRPATEWISSRRIIRSL